MVKKITITIISIILVITSFMGYRNSYDNRSASNLSSYCNIDFRGIIDPKTNKVQTATLSLVDYRFSKNPLEKFCIVDVDGKKYKVSADETYSIPPTYSLKDLKLETCFKYTNSLLVHFDPTVLKEIKNANTVKISFKYIDNDFAIELPLSEVDLNYWKNQLLLL